MTIIEVGKKQNARQEILSEWITHEMHPEDKSGVGQVEDALETSDNLASALGILLEYLLEKDILSLREVKEVLEKEYLDIKIVNQVGSNDEEHEKLLDYKAAKK